MATTEFAASVVVGATLARNFGQTLGTAQSRIRRLGDAAAKARIGKEISGDLSRLQGRLSELQREQLSAAGSSETLEREIRAVGAALRESKDRAKAHGLEIGDATREHRRFSDELDRTERKLERSQERQSRLADLRSTAAPVLGLAYAASRAVGSAMEVEEKQVYLRTVINTDDGDAEAAAERARKHAAEFARNSLASETEVLDIQYNLHSAGLSEAAATAGAEIAHKVAVATRGDSDQVAAVIGTTFNNLGEAIAGADPAEKIARIGDVLTQVQQKYQITDFGQLGEGMAEAAAGATSAKLPFEQAAVAIGMMNNAGTTGSSAGTALNAVLRQLPKAAEKLGASVVRTSDGSLDLAGSLAALRESLPPEDEVDARARAIQELFGDEGAKGLVPLLAGLDQYRDGLEAAGASAGTFETAYDEIADSAGGQWKMFVQNIQQVGTAFGSALLPVVGPVSAGLAAVAGWTGSLLESVPGLGAGIAGLVGGFAALVVVKRARAYLGTFGDEVRQAKAALVRMGRSLTLTNLKMKALAVGGAIKKAGSALVGLASGGLKAAAAGFRALTGAIAANPIGLVITGVVIAAALIWKYWKPIKAFLGRVFAPLVEFARPVFAWVSAKVAAFGGWLLGFWPPIKAFLGRVFTPLVEFAKPAFAWISAKVAAIGGWIREKLGAVGPAVGLLLGPIGLVVGAAVLLYRNWEPVSAFFGRVWAILGDGARAAFAALGRGWMAVKDGFSGLRNAVSTAVGAVVSYLRNFSFAEIGKNLIATLGEGVIAAKDALVDKVGGVFGAVRDLLPFSDAREGPFAALTTSGAAILDTVGAGVRRAGPGPLRRPLRSALGAAVVGLALPAAAAHPDALLRRPSGRSPRTAAARPQVVVSPGAVVLHFHGPADDPRRIAAEVERQLAALLRSADAEARLLEADSD